MTDKPIETYHVHEYLRSKLCALYENDCIFDKFECSWSGNERFLIYDLLIIVFTKIRRRKYLTVFSLLIMTDISQIR